MGKIESILLSWLLLSSPAVFVAASEATAPSIGAMESSSDKPSCLPGSRVLHENENVVACADNSDISSAATRLQENSTNATSTTNGGAVAPPRIPTEDTFRLLQQVYRSVKKDSPTVFPSDTLLWSALDNDGFSGFLVPIQVRNGPRGRGVFATQPIRKGQRVRVNARYGVFVNEGEWRNFLAKLNDDNLRHDVTVWAYVMEWDEETPFVLGLDLDEGSLMNHGPAPSATTTATVAAAANVETVYPNEENYLISELHALRDIKAGEELLCDYDSFVAVDHNLSWVQYSHRSVME